MHHAQLLVGSPEQTLSRIPEHERVPGPDTIVMTYERFGIDDARLLKSQATQRPLAKDARVFILQVRAITVEAQNALLKLLEEPVTTTRFYICVPDKDMLLLTVQSRLQSDAPTQETQTQTLANVFNRMSLEERLSQIATYAKEKDTQAMDQLLRELESLAYQNKNYNLLEDILFVRRYDRSIGASKKMLLEHIAITLS